MKPDDNLTPLAPPSDAALAMLPDQLESTTFPSRILVVDDDAGVRDVLGKVLRHADYRVSCAVDGEAGWEALRADRFDVLITDHDMPRLTGLDLLRRVRAAPLDVPVILISGSMPWAETDLLRLLPPGVALEKPFSFAELLAKVRAVLTATTRTGEIRDRQSLREFARHQPPPLGARVAG